MVRVDLFTNRSLRIRVETDRAMVPSQGVAACNGFAAQGKLVRFESTGAFVLQTPFILVSFQVTRWGLKTLDRQRCADYVVGTVGTQSIAQPWHTAPAC